MNCAAKEVGDRLESHQPITNIENNISEDYHRIIKQFLEADIDLNSINMK
jgi:hypothetical protein